MHIGLLQTGHVAETLIPKHGDYDSIFQIFLAGRGLTFTNYPVVDDVFPESADACEGWLITGSKFGAYEDHDWIPKLMDLVREIHARELPLVGICFGHQIIAQALGGRVEKYSGGWAVGPKRYDFNDWGALTLNAWHQDQVVTLPEGAEVIAQNDFCRYPALAYGSSILSLQPHPEIRPAYMQGLIEERGPGIVPEAILKDAAEAIETPLHEAFVAEKIAAFFKAGKEHHV